MGKAKRGLTMKQEKFKQAYLDCLNGSEAYRRAYNQDATDTVASVCAAKLLANASIQDAIEESRKYTSGKHNITRERVIKTLAALAFPDKRVLYDEFGSLRNINELTLEQASIIEGMETVEMIDRDGMKTGDVRKVKLSSQKGAIDSLSKLLGFNEPEKIKSEVTNNFPNGVLQVVVVAAPESAKDKEL